MVVNDGGKKMIMCNIHDYSVYTLCTINIIHNAKLAFQANSEQDGKLLV